MEIIQIISEHKHIRKDKPVKRGEKRVEAIVNDFGRIETRHIDILQ